MNLLWFILPCLLGLAGCVTVQPDRKLTIEDLHYGEAAVFVAVTWEASSSSELELVFNDSLAVLLHSRAINRVFLPEGWYGMALPQLAQPLDNARMRYRFRAGEIYRFALLKRYPVSADSLHTLQTSAKPDYLLSASTRDAFSQLLLEENLPVYNLAAEETLNR